MKEGGELAGQAIALVCIRPTIIPFEEVIDAGRESRDMDHCDVGIAND